MKGSAPLILPQSCEELVLTNPKNDEIGKLKVNFALTALSEVKIAFTVGKERDLGWEELYYLALWNANIRSYAFANTFAERGIALRPTDPDLLDVSGRIHTNAECVNSCKLDLLVWCRLVGGDQVSLAGVLFCCTAQTLSV